MYPIIDFHCDLLSCVENPTALLNFYSPETNCSLPQLKLGNVLIQTFAIATITNDRSLDSGLRQGLLYQKLLQDHAAEVASIRSFNTHVPKIYGLLSLENASALLGEDEPVELLFDRLQFFQEVETICYISLTWNHENRFGGGNNTAVGLKEDGKVLLDYLDQRRIAIDLSHTSDRLAYDILNYIQKQNLAITPIASHSNFRSLAPINRNLPDEIAKEILRLNGIIGLNLIKRFIGTTEDDITRQIDYAFKIGAMDRLVFGADFYGGLDPSYISSLMPDKTWPTFFPSFSNASCYQRLCQFLLKDLGEDLINKLSHLNALNFLKNQKII